MEFLLFIHIYIYIIYNVLSSSTILREAQLSTILREAHYPQPNIIVAIFQQIIPKTAITSYQKQQMRKTATVIYGSLFQG